MRRDSRYRFPRVLHRRSPSYTTASSDTMSVDDLCHGENFSRSDCRQHLVVAAPAKIGAALETRIDVAGGDFLSAGDLLFNRSAALEHVERDPGLLRAQTHRHEAALALQ